MLNVVWWRLLLFLCVYKEACEVKGFTSNVCFDHQRLVLWCIVCYGLTSSYILQLSIMFNLQIISQTGRGNTFIKNHSGKLNFYICLKWSQPPYICNLFSGPAAFRPRAHAAASYTPSVEKGRPILQGLLAIDLLMKEVMLNYYFYTFGQWVLFKA